MGPCPKGVGGVAQICVLGRVAAAGKQPFDVLSIASTLFRRIRRFCPRPRCLY
jgi:hypothetical protein